MMKFKFNLISYHTVIPCPAFTNTGGIIFNRQPSLDLSKDTLLNRIEHEYICCDTNLVINGRF